MKHEWRRAERQFYAPGSGPVVVDVPEFTFVAVHVTGDPNLPAFAERVSALYAVAYGVKMYPRRHPEPGGWHDWTIYPLEATWTATRPDWTKDDLRGVVMIRQPAWVPPEVLDMALAGAAAKVVPEIMAGVWFVRQAEGRAVQALHKGPFGDEPATFERMAVFCADNGLERVGYEHREIYLTDPRRSAPEKQRTILRYRVRPVSSVASGTPGR